MPKPPSSVSSTTASWCKRLRRGQGGALQPPLPERHRAARQHRPARRGRRDIARLKTLLREREIAAAEADARSERWPTKPTTRRSARTAARSGRGSSCPTKMDKTVVVAVIDRVRHRRYGKTLQRTKQPLRARRGQRGPRGRPRAHQRDPADLEARSAGASSRCWSVPGDPAGVPAQGGRQLGRPRGAVHQGARRHPASLRRRSATSSSRR